MERFQSYAIKTKKYVNMAFLQLFALFVLPSFVYAQFAVIDIEAVLLNSNAAHLGREHIKQVRANLEMGYNDFIKELDSLPEKNRNKELQEAAKALNQQLELEKWAVNQVINQLMLEEIRKYRINNKLALVLPKQLALDVDA